MKIKIFIVAFVLFSTSIFPQQKNRNGALLLKPLTTVEGAFNNIFAIGIEGQTALDELWAGDAYIEIGDSSNLFLFSGLIGMQARPWGSDFLDGVYFGLYPGYTIILDKNATYYDDDSQFILRFKADIGYEWLIGNNGVLNISAGAIYTPMFSTPIFAIIELGIGFRFEDPFYKI